MSSCLVNTVRLTTNADRQLILAFVMCRYYSQDESRNKKDIERTRQT